MDRDSWENSDIRRGPSRGTLNTTSIRRVLATLLGPLIMATPASANFITVINAPPTVIGDQESIGSHTQLNVGLFGGVGEDFDAGDPDGTSTNVEVNVSGGIVEQGFTAHAGSRVNVTDGIVRNLLTAGPGSEVRISGGRVGSDLSGSLQALSGSKVHISGGTVGGRLNAGAGGLVEISGGTVGDDVSAAPDSVITVRGGSIGKHFYAHSGSVVYISGGTVDQDFRSYSGTVNVSGGHLINAVRVYYGTEVNITGGSFGDVFLVNSRSVVNMTNGSVGDHFRAYTETVVNISGGTVGRFFNANDRSVVNIRGGEIGIGFQAFSGSTVNVFGTEFFLDGNPVALTPGIPLEVTARDVRLTGMLADGSDLRLELNSTVLTNEFFLSDALLTLTQVSAVPGDFDNNVFVDQGDLDLVLHNWGADVATLPASWINLRPIIGIVDQAELDQVLQNWGGTAAPDFRGVDVPEPGVAAAVLLGLATAGPRTRGRVRWRDV